MAEENKGETTTLSSVIRSGKKTVYFIAFFLFSDIPRASTATGAKAEFIFSGPLSRRVVPRFSRRARLRGLTLYGKLYIGEKSAPTAHTFVLSQHRRCRRRPRNVFIFLLSSLRVFSLPIRSRPRPFLISMIYAPRRRKSAALFPVVRLSVRGAFVYL